MGHLLSNGGGHGLCAVQHFFEDFCGFGVTQGTDDCGRWLEGASPERRALVEHALRHAIKRGEAGALSLLGYGGQPKVGAVIDGRPARAALVGERERGVGASRFHATLVAIMVAVATRERVPDVVLAGGCFQNAVLANAAARQLRAAGLRPWLAERAPIGDGGLALGQLQVARWRLAGH